MTTALRFLEALDSEVGYVEADGNHTKFASEAGHVNGFPWCATVLVAVAKRTGLVLPSYSAYTPTMALAFQKAGRWHHDPEPGDFSFWDFPETVHRIQHVEAVQHVRSDGSLDDIGGNTAPDNHGSQHNGGGVYRRHRDRRYCVGFGRPAYSDAVVPPPPPATVEDDDVFAFRNLEDGKVWIVERGKRRHVERPELNAYIQVGAVGEPPGPPEFTKDMSAVFMWRYPEG